MIEAIIRWSVRARGLVVVAALVLTVIGIGAIRTTPVDALPDLSDVQVIIRTTYPGQAPQIVENQVTYPLTTTMLSVPGARVVRGYAIMRGAVQYPFREYAYRGCQLAFLYFAVTSLYGSQIGMFALGGLPGQFASALGGSDVGGLGGYYDKLAGTGFETANTMRKIASDYQDTQGTLPDIGYAVFAGFLVVMVIVATLLCAAIGFVISAFGLFALALLSVVGPLFVAALLFESTRGYFFAWLGACINYLMLIVFALVLTLFLTQTGDAIIATISENDEIGMAAIKALAFYALGFFFFLQIPMLAASLGGGGPALANQFASAIAAAGGFVAGRGATATQATSRAIERGFARGIARMRTSGSVSRGTQ